VSRRWCCRRAYLDSRQSQSGFKRRSRGELTQGSHAGHVGGLRPGGYLGGVSVEVTVDELFAEIAEWGAGFVATVGDDHRVRLVALRPQVATRPDGRVLRFAHAGPSTLNNAHIRERLAIAFPPHAGSNGYSLIVDGLAMVDEDAGQLDVRPLTAVRHRPAP
jgi:hypothetical protein